MNTHCQVLAATVAVGHLFTVNDSSIGVVVKRSACIAGSIRRFILVANVMKA